MLKRIKNYESERVRNVVQNLYGVDVLPSDIPKHYLWQAPLLFTNYDSLREHALKAADLWLCNYDLSLFDELILIELSSGFTLECNREIQLGHPARIRGPINGIYKIKDAFQIAQTSFHYSERYSKNHD